MAQKIKITHTSNADMNIGIPKNLTAVEWLYERFLFAGYAAPGEWKEQDKEMEKEQRNKDYNAGYTDAQCNHINDAENYANEIDYLQSRIDEIDSKIKAKQNSIADMLINGNTNNK